MFVYPVSIWRQVISHNYQWVIARRPFYVAYRQHKILSYSVFIPLFYITTCSRTFNNAWHDKCFFIYQLQYWGQDHLISISLIKAFILRLRCWQRNRRQRKAHQARVSGFPLNHCHHSGVMSEGYTSAARLNTKEFSLCLHCTARSRIVFWPPSRERIMDGSSHFLSSYQCHWGK